MSDFRIDKITNRAGDTGTQIAGITTFSGTSGMVMPKGSSDDRGGRGRAVYAGGYSPGASPYALSSVMNYVEIATTGNASDFGDMTQTKTGMGNASSSTRGFIMGGRSAHPNTHTSRIEYVTFSSKGDGTDWADLVYGDEGGLARGAGCSDQTRGIYYGGYIGGSAPAYTMPAKGSGRQVEAINMASTGKVEFFGDQFFGRYSMPGVASPTRGVFLGGIAGPTSPNSNVIDYVTIQTMGDGLDFGDLSAGRRLFGACSNTTRGITGGGMQPSDVDTMEYITIASTGNALDFGNLLSAAKKNMAAGTLTRGVWAGGYASPIAINVIQYVQIATTGNATDFGDLTQPKDNGIGLSDAHGGLG